MKIKISEAEGPVLNWMVEIESLKEQVTTQHDVLMRKDREIEALKSEVEMWKATANASVDFDAVRYRWLMGSRTAEQCADESIGEQPPTPSDIVMASLSSWYVTKQDADSAIDRAMKQGVTK